MDGLTTGMKNCQTAFGSMKVFKTAGLIIVKAIKLVRDMLNFSWLFFKTV
jgi:hypothetical protein